MQKKAYKLLAYICEHRADFLLANCQDLTDCLLAGVITSLSAAKRYRLRCLKALILLLQSNAAPEIHGAATLQDAGQTETRQQVCMHSFLFIYLNDNRFACFPSCHHLIWSLAQFLSLSVDVS